MFLTSPRTTRADQMTTNDKSNTDEDDDKHAVARVSDVKHHGEMFHGLVGELKHRDERDKKNAVNSTILSTN